MGAVGTNCCQSREESRSTCCAVIKATEVPGSEPHLAQLEAPPATNPPIPSGMLCCWSLRQSLSYNEATETALKLMQEGDPGWAGRLERIGAVLLWQRLVDKLASPGCSLRLRQWDVQMLVCRFGPADGASMSVDQLERAVRRIYLEWSAGRLLMARWKREMIGPGLLHNLAEARHAVLRASEDAGPFCLWVARQWWAGRTPSSSEPRCAGRSRGLTSAGRQLVEMAELLHLEAGRSASGEAIPASGFSFGQFLAFCEEVSFVVCWLSWAVGCSEAGGVRASVCLVTARGRGRPSRFVQGVQALARSRSE